MPRSPAPTQLGLFGAVEAVEAVVLKHRESGQEILVVHGHQGDLPNDQAWQFSRLSLRYFWTVSYTHLTLPTSDLV